MITSKPNHHKMKIWVNVILSICKNYFIFHYDFVCLSIHLCIWVQCYRVQKGTRLSRDGDCLQVKVNLSLLQKQQVLLITDISPQLLVHALLQCRINLSIFVIWGGVGTQPHSTLSSILLLSLELNSMKYIILRHHSKFLGLTLSLQK